MSELEDLATARAAPHNHLTILTHQNVVATLVVARPNSRANVSWLHVLMSKLVL